MNRRSIFMSETDPNNPYGQNYIEQPYKSKIYYKFNQVKSYVHLEDEDDDFINQQATQMAAGIVTSFLTSFGVGHFLNKFLMKKQMLLSHVICAGIGAFGTTTGYYYFSDRYVDNVCEKIVNKYKEQAVQNGFEDYEIS